MKLPDEIYLLLSSNLQQISRGAKFTSTSSEALPGVKTDFELTLEKYVSVKYKFSDLLSSLIMNYVFYGKRSLSFLEI